MASHIDGIHFRDRVILVALGIDAKGNKHVLGLREGSTEASRVVRSLLSDLVDRGLDADRARLWVIDGGKPCASHRRMLGALPHPALPGAQAAQRDRAPAAGTHASVGRAMRDAWNGANSECQEDSGAPACARGWRRP